MRAQGQVQKLPSPRNQRRFGILHTLAFWCNEEAAAPDLESPGPDFPHLFCCVLSEERNTVAG